MCRSAAGVQASQPLQCRQGPSMRVRRISRQAALQDRLSHSSHRASYASPDPSATAPAPWLDSSVASRMVF